MIPVSIRTKNPGAMWPGPVSAKFGSTSHENLRDGNKAAIFATYEQGAAAQFYLWDKKYAGKTLQSAIYEWSGHNSSKAYAQFLDKRLPDVKMDTVITEDFLQSDEGREFMKAQAQWEAGRPYPMTDEQWKAGQDLAFAKTVRESQPELGGEVSAPAPAPEPEPKVIVSTDVPVTKPLTHSKTFWGQIAVAASAVMGYATDWKVLAVAGILVIAGFVIWDRMGKPDIKGLFK